MGAPQARQIADRFHLIQNASAALEELLRGRQRRIERAPAPTELASSPPAAPPTLNTRERQRAAQRQARASRWEEARQLHASGMSISGIARQLGMGRGTVRRLLESSEPPRYSTLHRKPSDLHSPSLQPFVAYLQARWQAGCQNISQLYREIKAQGYARSRSLLAQALLPWRPPRPAPGQRQKRRRLSVRWLCLRPPAQLDVDEQEALTNLLASDPELNTGYQLLQRFRRMIAERQRDALDGWLTDAQTSGLPSFISLANGLIGDRAAVEAALETEWSNGRVEGFVHKVKLIKRQGYGRASLSLLRARVLAA